MLDEYDFSNVERNPYADKLSRRQVTMNLDGYVVDYFKGEAERTGIPYQHIINFYLSQCALEGKQLTFA